jgi:hypothetical protein
MDIIHDHESGVVRKGARTAKERETLGREAAVLRAIAHPGVVQLIGVHGGDPPDGLLLRRETGGDLAALADEGTEVVAGLGAALATTVADLHDLGVSHGAIEPSHVLLDEQGRPVLCSFGRAQLGPVAGGTAAARRDDIRALSGLLLDRLPPGAPSRTVRALRRAATPGPPHRGRDARWLARQLASTVPGARLPDPHGGPTQAGQAEDKPALAGRANSPAEAGRPAGATRGRAGELAAAARRRPRRIAIGLSVVGAGAALVTSAWPRAAISSVPCPAADLGCTAVRMSKGILVTATGRYQLAGPGDVVVVGRWSCGPNALPAVLGQATGEVWTFRAWPTPAHPEVGQLAGRVPLAQSLRVRPEPSGCDQLVVVRRGLPAVTLDSLHP